MNDAQFAQRSTDASPRTYRVSAGWRFFLLVLCAILGAPSAAGIWYFGTGHDAHDIASRLLLACICTGFVILSAYLAHWTLVARVSLWPDRIEIRELFTTNVLPRRNILGRRLEQPSKGPAYLVLIPRDKNEKKIKIGKMFNFDSFFHEWVTSLPDLDAEDVRATEREIANNQEIGATPQERIDALNRARSISRLLTAITFALCAWAFLYPRPYHIALSALILIPWVALAVAARSHGLFRVDQKKNDPHPTVAIPFIFPGFVLMLRVVTDINVVGWKPALYLSLAVALTLTVGALAVDPSLRTTARGTAVVLFLLSMAYGYGAGMATNASLDHSAVSVYRARVTHKAITTGRHRSYDLYLAPWGPKQQPNKVSVSNRLYQSLKTNDSVCLAVRSGAFRVPWYTVHACPEPHSTD